MIFRKFFLGFIRIHILYHASKEPVYGTMMMTELGHHGYHISPGTIYPILHDLEKLKFIKSRKKNVGGRIRVYYSITPKGQRLLEDARLKISELVHEVME